MKFYKEELKKLESEMDKLDQFRLELKKVYDTHGWIPEKYLLAWENWKKEGFKMWRNIPGVMKKIHKAAKKAAKIRRKNAQ